MRTIDGDGRKVLIESIQAAVNRIILDFDYIQELSLIEDVDSVELKVKFSPMNYVKARIFDL